MHASSSMAADDCADVDTAYIPLAAGPPDESASRASCRRQYLTLSTLVALLLFGCFSALFGAAGGKNRAPPQALAAAVESAPLLCYEFTADVRKRQIFDHGRKQTHGDVLFNAGVHIARSLDFVGTIAPAEPPFDKPFTNYWTADTSWPERVNC